MTWQRKSPRTTLVKIGDKRQLVFKPLKDGETNVVIRDAEGTIRLIFQVKVAKSILLTIATELRDFCGMSRGLRCASLDGA